MVTHEQSEDRTYWLRRAHAAAMNATLDRDERIDFAGMILYTDIHSWSQLTVPDLRRIVDGLRGWMYVNEIHRQKGLP